MQRLYTGDLPSTNVLHNACNGFFAFGGIDGDVSEEICASVERLHETMRALKKDTETCNFVWGPKLFLIHSLPRTSRAVRIARFSPETGPH